MDRVHYNVSGMANNEDKTKVKNALGKIDGVQMIAVDMGRGTVEVAYNNPADEHSIKNCIEKAGFRTLN
mgnify:CR=1 FL=1